MSGWKSWAVNEVVDADDFQSYIQDQVVQIYAGTAARGSALGTAVTAGMVSYLTDSAVLQYYTGSVWANVSSVGDISAVTAGTGLSGGGTSGDVTLNVNYAAVGSAVLASPNITGTAVIAAGSVTGNLALTGNLNSVTPTELGYLSGVTSAVQTQLGARVLTTNGAVTTAAVGSAVVRNITLSTAAPGTASGGIDGDVWLVYTP